MFYEAKAKVVRLSEKGDEKEITEHYILQDVESFSEAEVKISEELAADNVEFDVFWISRSNVIEIVNKKEEGKPFFKATIVDTTIDDKGKEQKKKYYNLVCASDVREANTIMEQHLAQGLSDMELDGIVKTKILDLI